MTFVLLFVWLTTTDSEFLNQLTHSLEIKICSDAYASRQYWNQIQIFIRQSKERTASLSSWQKQKIIDQIAKGFPTYLAKIITNIPQIKTCVHELYLKDINKQCKKLCAKSQEMRSVLRVNRNDHKNTKNFHWIDILRKIKERTPIHLDILVTVAVRKVKDDASQLPLLCVAMGILMNIRSRELSLVQKVNSVILGSGGVPKKVKWCKNIRLIPQHIYV